MKTQKLSIICLVDTTFDMGAFLVYFFSQKFSERQKMIETCRRSSNKHSQNIVTRVGNDKSSLN